MKITKMQIETAAEVLTDALNEKAREIGKKRFETENKKIHKLIEAFNKKGQAFVDEYKKHQKALQQILPEGISVRNADSYGSPVRDLIDDMNRQTNVKQIDYIDMDESKFYPKLAEEKAEINRYILNLKLGTAMMSELDTMLAKISKIK